MWDANNELLITTFFANLGRSNVCDKNSSGFHHVELIFENSESRKPVIRNIGMKKKLWR